MGKWPFLFINFNFTVFSATVLPNSYNNTYAPRYSPIFSVSVR